MSKDGQIHTNFLKETLAILSAGVFLHEGM
nr:MAG TPA: hypothetical protein [Caudoviricetes sp.]